MPARFGILPALRQQGRLEMARACPSQAYGCAPQGAARS